MVNINFDSVITGKIEKEVRGKERRKKKSEEKKGLPKENYIFFTELRMNANISDGDDN